MVDVASGSEVDSTEYLDYSGSPVTADLCRRIEQHLPDYEIHAPIGAGGQGVLFLGCQANTDRSVAIKLIPPTSNGQASARALREAKLLARVSHPHIVSILACGEVRGYVYLVMDYVLGEPIDRMMEIVRPSVPELVAIYVKICRAVAFAHSKGIIHRDLKPANVVLGADDHEPRLLDFGLARDLGQSASPPGSRGRAVGTLPYSSPEQVTAQGLSVDLRTDIYSLGVLFYQVLSATFPYGVEEPDAVTVEMIREVLPKPLRNAASIGYDAPHEQRQRVPDDVEKIVFKALEKDPGRRYQTADEMAEDFERFLRGEAVHAKAMSRLYVFRKFLRRHRIAAGVGLVLAASSIGVATAAVQSASAGQEAAAAKQEAEAAKTDADTAKRQLEIAQAALSMADLNAEGNKLRGEGETEKAAEAFERALAIAAGFGNDEPEIRRREFGALYGLAEMYYIAKKPERATPHCRAAVQLAERMHADLAGDAKEGPSWHDRIAYARELEGWAAAAVGKWKEAALAYREAERIRRMELARQPGAPLLRRRLAIDVSRLGSCERKLGHYKVAYDLLVEARSLYLQNIGALPGSEKDIVSLANAEISIANWHIVQDGMEHASEARALLDAAELRLADVRELVADRDRSLGSIQDTRLLIENRGG